MSAVDRFLNIKAIKGSKCQVNKCNRLAEYWSALPYTKWDIESKLFIDIGVQYRCEDHCDPTKWFYLEEDDY